MQNSGFTSNSTSNQQSAQPSAARQVPIHSFTTNSRIASAPNAPVFAEQDMKGSMKSSRNLVIILAIVVVCGGVATGIGIGKLRAAQTTGGNVYQGKAIQAVAGSNIKNGDIFGSAKESDFKDSADGYMEAGGIGGEGSDKLLRPGGVSQTVYLTSSVTDLSKFEGMKVKVWGETFHGQKAGWLMDVGRVEVIDTKAQPPTEK